MSNNWTNIKKISNRVLIWVIFIVFVWLVITNISKTEKIINVLLQGKFQWIGLAILFQISYYFVYPVLMKKIFSLLNLDVRRGYLQLLYLATKFTDVITPSSSASKLALFSTLAAKLNQSTSRMLTSAIFLLIFDTISFLVIGLPIVAYLLAGRQLAEYTLWSYVILFVIVAICLGFFSLVFQKKINHLTDKIPFAKIRHFFDSLSELEVTPKILKETYTDAVSFGLVNHLINIATLSAVFLAFNQSFNPFVILQTYLVGMLFSIISITPQGLGSAEPLMIFTMTSQGVPLEKAAVITLAFRGLLFWLPIFPGFFAFRKISRSD